MKITKFLNLNIKIEPHRTLNHSKGVVKSLQLKGCTDEELVTELRSQGVTEAFNIKIKKEDQIITTNTWILTFNFPTPPAQLKIPCSSNLKVQPYIPKPMTCKKCLKIGHTEKKNVNLKRKKDVKNVVKTIKKILDKN